MLPYEISCGGLLDSRWCCSLEILGTCERAFLQTPLIHERHQNGDQPPLILQVSARYREPRRLGNVPLLLTECLKHIPVCHKLLPGRPRVHPCDFRFFPAATPTNRTRLGILDITTIYYLWGPISPECGNLGKIWFNPGLRFWSRTMNDTKETDLIQKSGPSERCATI